MKTPFNDVKYVGEDLGGCPRCHNDLIHIQDGKYLTCPTCFAHGKLEMVGDSIRFVLIDREVEKSSNKTSEFKKVHDNHLARNWEIMAENKEIIDKKFEKYAAYKKPVVPPPLKEK